jgi:hypothetical protein
MYPTGPTRTAFGDGSGVVMGVVGTAGESGAGGNGMAAGRGAASRMAWSERNLTGFSKDKKKSEKQLVS